MIKRLQYNITLYKREVQKGEYGCEQPLYIKVKAVKGSFSDRDYEKGLKDKEYAMVMRDRVTVYIDREEPASEGGGIGLEGNFYEITRLRKYHSHMKITAERRTEVQWI